MPGSGPPKKKTQSQLRRQRERNLCLSIFYCDPRGLGPDPRLREKPRLPRGHRADRRLPADSALPTSAGEGAGREERLGIKPCTPGPRAASPFSVSTALTHPVNTRCSGRVFSGQGGRDEGEPLAARAQASPGPAPGPPSPYPGWAGLGRGGGSRDAERLVPSFLPQRHEQRPRAGPGARLPHALGRGGLPGPSLPAAE